MEVLMLKPSMVAFSSSTVALGAFAPFVMGLISTCNLRSGSSSTRRKKKKKSESDKRPGWKGLKSTKVPSSKGTRFHRFVRYLKNRGFKRKKKRCFEGTYQNQRRNWNRNRSFSPHSTRHPAVGSCSLLRQRGRRCRRPRHQSNTADSRPCLGAPFLGRNCCSCPDRLPSSMPYCCHRWHCHWRRPLPLWTGSVHRRFSRWTRPSLSSSSTPSCCLCPCPSPFCGRDGFSETLRTSPFDERYALVVRKSRESTTQQQQRWQPNEWWNEGRRDRNK